MLYSRREEDKGERSIVATEYCEVRSSTGNSRDGVWSMCSCRHLALWGIQPPVHPVLQCRVCCISSSTHRALSSRDGTVPENIHIITLQYFYYFDSRFHIPQNLFQQNKEKQWKKNNKKTRENDEKNNKKVGTDSYHDLGARTHAMSI